MAKRLRRGVYRNENNIGILDGRRNISAKEQVAATGTLHDIVQAGFKNRKAIAIPGVNSGLVDINNGYFYIGTLVGDNSHGGATDVASTNTNNSSFETHNALKLENYDSS